MKTPLHPVFGSNFKPIGLLGILNYLLGKGLPQPETHTLGHTANLPHEFRITSGLNFSKEVIKVRDKKLLALLGSAVLFGLGGISGAQPQQGQSTCGAMGGGMKKENQKSQEGKEKTSKEKKSKEKKKQKEMTWWRSDDLGAQHEEAGWMIRRISSTKEGKG
ncbi:MAG: hypothetical protein Q9N34_02110 [Aquificota bacterium]|nr:hypothetical protein [Aquificota bacterium]